MYGLQVVPDDAARHPRRPVARAVFRFDGAQLIRHSEAGLICCKWTGRDEAPAARCLIYSYFAEALRVGVDQGVQGVEGVGGGCDEEEPSHLCLMAGMAAGVLEAIETRDEETNLAGQA